MEIRIAVKDDVIKIESLVASLSHFYLKNKDAELPKWFANSITDAAFSKRIEASEYANFVYALKGEIVGYISMKSGSHLYHLFVAEPHQGKGISRELWEFTAKMYVSHTYTLRSSLNAVPVYKRFGFLESGAASEKDGIGFQPMELRR